MVKTSVKQNWNNKVVVQWGKHIFTIIMLSLIIPPHNKIVGGILVSLCPSVCQSIHLSVRPAFRVRSVTPTVLDGLFPDWAQIITSMRGCVVHNDLWPSPISLRPFSHGVAKKPYWNMAHLVASTLQHVQFWKDSFHIGHKWSLAWEGVLRVITFALDLYLQGHLTILLKGVSHAMIFDLDRNLQAVMLPILWTLLCGINAIHVGMICYVPFPSQMSRSHGSFKFLRSGQGVS